MDYMRHREQLGPLVLKDNQDYREQQGLLEHKVLLEILVLPEYEVLLV
jgi:hypothetical protein